MYELHNRHMSYHRTHILQINTNLTLSFSCILEAWTRHVFLSKNIVLNNRISLTVYVSSSTLTLSPTSYGCLIKRKMIEVNTSESEFPMSQLRPRMSVPAPVMRVSNWASYWISNTKHNDKCRVNMNSICEGGGNIDLRVRQRWSGLLRWNKRSSRYYPTFPQHYPNPASNVQSRVVLYETPYTTTQQRRQQKTSQLLKLPNFSRGSHVHGFESQKKKGKGRIIRRRARKKSRTNKPSQLPLYLHPHSNLYQK